MKLPFPFPRFRALDWALLAVLLLVIALLALSGPEPAPSAPAETAAVQEVEDVVAATPQAAKYSPKRWGIEIEGLRLALGGNLLDFRYKVLDPAKASFMTRQQDESTFFLDETSGLKLPLGNSYRSGSLHRAAAELAEGQRCFMHFPNPGKTFKRGDKVTLVMGEFRVQNLAVE